MKKKSELTHPGNDEFNNSNEDHLFDVMSAEIAENSTIPEIVRSEVNLLTLPFFALWDKDVKKRTKAVYKAVAERDGKRIEISWMVAANPEFGYPGPFDRNLHRAIEQIIGEFPIPVQNPVPIGSFYDIIGRMGLKDSGRTYQQIKDALLRIIATTVVSKSTYYNKGRKQWIEDAFHLYDRVTYKGDELPSGEIADTNYLFLNSWYLENINARYVKPIDWRYYTSLKTPITQRLYELLSVKFYGLIIKKRGVLSYKYSTLCDLLPMARQEYLSLAKQSLDPAHRKLKKTGFLENWEWEEISQRKKTKDWMIQYYPGWRAKEEIKRFRMMEQPEFAMLPEPGEGSQNGIRETRLSEEESLMADELEQRGITRDTARELAVSYPMEQIKRQTEIFDWLIEMNSPLIGRNPAGFLRKAIQENYQPPEDYQEYVSKKAREQKIRERGERWLKVREGLIRRDLAEWDKTRPEERVKGRLEFWIKCENLNGRSLSTDQIEMKIQELCDSLPKDNQEKVEYISRSYPEEPPEEFE